MTFIRTNTIWNEGDQFILNEDYGCGLFPNGDAGFLPKGTIVKLSKLIKDDGTEWQKLTDSANNSIIYSRWHHILVSPDTPFRPY